MQFNFIHRLLGRVFGLILGVLLCGGVWMVEPLALQSAVSVFILPPNFQMRTVVGGLNYPTDMALLPSGDMLVTEKGTGQGTNGVAHVRLVSQGVLVDEPVMSLSVTVVGDSGIYSIALDPAFAENHYFYIWYSVGEQAKEWPGQSVDRLARFIYDPQLGKADPLGETIILDGIRWSQWHNGGGLGFDDEGNVLIATGDAAASHLGQDMTTLNGKLLRIRPSVAGGYTVPSDNPFVGEEEILAEIYATGLRNPFRMSWNAEQHVFYLIDVGADSWEEVNQVAAGANFGWAKREGPCPFQASASDCPPAEPIYTDPLIAYPHPPDSGAGISALTFYTGTAWPQLYRGKLFFADFNSHSISMVDLADPQTVTIFGDEIGHAVDLEPTEEGLYLLSIYDGEIRFIYYTEGGNQWPTAQVSATPTQGTAPLMVEFSALGSTDPEDDALRYVWDFGDGSTTITSTEPVITHSYVSDGDYEASLQVVDAHGGKSEAQRLDIEVYSGAMPTILQEIVGAAQRQRYRGGDAVRFSVERTGGKTGLDAATPYIWSVKQHHNQHVHFIITEFAGDEALLEIADDSHAATNATQTCVACDNNATHVCVACNDVSLWYEVELTMLTDQGQTVRVTRALHPDVVAMDIRSSPPGAEMMWNGVAQDSTQPIEAVVGQRFVLEAPPVVYHDNSKNGFARWQISDEGGVDETITERSFELLVSADAKSYVAYYDFISPAQANFLPSIINITTTPVE